MDRVCADSKLLLFRCGNLMPTSFLMESLNYAKEIVEIYKIIQDSIIKSKNITIRFNLLNN